VVTHQLFGTGLLAREDLSSSQRHYVRI